MKRYLVLLLLVIDLSAFTLHMKTFSANFTQTIIDDKNTTIRYFGNIQAKQPDMVRWNYTKPIKKEVYIDRDRITIIEPQIEQAIVTKINNMLAFFKVLKNAKKIDDNHYISFYNHTKLHLSIKKGMIMSISYMDQLQNKIVIRFSDQIQNGAINDQLFQAHIPKEYDVITR